MHTSIGFSGHANTYATSDFIKGRGDRRREGRGGKGRRGCGDDGGTKRLHVTLCMQNKECKESINVDVGDCHTYLAFFISYGGNKINLIA